MRSESKVSKQCRIIYKELKLDKHRCFKNSKVLLKMYRSIVWSVSHRANSLLHEKEFLSSRDLSKAMIFLENFSSEYECYKIRDEVDSMIESKFMIQIIEDAVEKIKSYPDYGALYYDILVKQYLSEKKYSEGDMLETLNIERSTFYDRKREAIDVFTICLWSHIVPDMRVTYSTIINEMSVGY